MGRNEIFEQALSLKADDRFLLIEALLKSIDNPDTNINEIWEEEAQRRVDSYKKGDLKVINEEEFFSATHSLFL